MPKSTSESVLLTCFPRQALTDLEMTEAWIWLRWFLFPWYKPSFWDIFFQVPLANPRKSRFIASCVFSFPPIPAQWRGSAAAIAIGRPKRCPVENQCSACLFWVEHSHPIVFVWKVYCFLRPLVLFCKTRIFEKAPWFQIFICSDSSVFAPLLAVLQIVPFLRSLKVVSRLAFQTCMHNTAPLLPTMEDGRRSPLMRRSLSSSLKTLSMTKVESNLASRFNGITMYIYTNICVLCTYICICI